MAKGLAPAQALVRHGHGHAVYAMLAALRAEAGWAISGTAVIEVLFGLPGISQFLVQSIAYRDYFVLQAYVMVAALWMLAMNAAIGLALSRIDARVA
jgi:ABC-type dipeptide/oligopeptide/nickel transport system permease component